MHALRSINNVIGLLATPIILSQTTGITVNTHMYGNLVRVTLLQVREVEVVVVRQSPQYEEMIL